MASAPVVPDCPHCHQPVSRKNKCFDYSAFWCTNKECDYSCFYDMKKLYNIHELPDKSMILCEREPVHNYPINKFCPHCYENSVKEDRARIAHIKSVVEELLGEQSELEFDLNRGCALCGVKHVPLDNDFSATDEAFCESCYKKKKEKPFVASGRSTKRPRIWKNL